MCLNGTERDNYTLYLSEYELYCRHFAPRIYRHLFSFLGIFRPRKDEVTGQGRRLRNEELNYLLSVPNSVRVIKWRRMRWAGHVARMGEERGVYRVLVAKPDGRNHWGDLGVDGWIILGWIFRSWDVGI